MLFWQEWINKYTRIYIYRYWFSYISYFKELHICGGAFIFSRTFLFHKDKYRSVLLILAYLRCVLFHWQIIAIKSDHLGTFGLGFIFAAALAEYWNAEDGCVPEKKMVITGRHMLWHSYVLYLLPESRTNCKQRRL